MSPRDVPCTDLDLYLQWTDGLSQEDFKSRNLSKLIPIRDDDEAKASFRKFSNKFLSTKQLQN